MSLLESLNDPSRHSKQPNSFAAVQTRWNKSGTTPPKPQANTETRTTAAVSSNGEMNTHKFQKEVSRLDMKITKVATTLGTLYNQINLLIEKQNTSVVSSGHEPTEAGQHSLKTGKTSGPGPNKLEHIVTRLEKIINDSKETQNREAYAWRDVSFFMMGVTSMCLLSSAFLVYNLKQKNT